MRLYLLGSLEIHDRHGVLVDVTGQKRRALLATLVVRAGRTVSADRLIEELWGEHPPANAANALQAHIRRLRKVIEEACGEPDRIVTRPPGYLLRLRPGETDAAEFVEQVGRAKAFAGTEPERVVPLLRSALALWRGPALDGCVLGDVCAAEAVVLEEHRLTALETLYDASLRAGRHAEVIGELEETSAAYPMRERFYDQLMVALYRSDRQSDAIGVYDRARHRLLQELGVEPGPALRARVRAILANTPAAALDLEAAAPEHVQPDQSPEQGHDFARNESAELSRELAELQQRIDTLASRQELLLESLRTLGRNPDRAPGGRARAHDRRS